MYVGPLESGGEHSRQQERRRRPLRFYVVGTLRTPRWAISDVALDQPWRQGGLALLAGMALAVTGLLFLAWMPNPASPFDIGWRLVLTALGYGLFVSPNSRLLIGAAPRERSAAAGGLLSTVRLLGQTMAAALVGLMLTLGVGTGPVPMLIAAGLGVVAALCSLARFQSSRALGGEKAAAAMRG